jgi:hypothetical protein
LWEGNSNYEFYVHLYQRSEKGKVYEVKKGITAEAEKNLVSKSACRHRSLLNIWIVLS